MLTISILCYCLERIFIPQISLVLFGKLSRKSVPLCSIFSFSLHLFRPPRSPFNWTPFQVGATRKHARLREDSSWFPPTNAQMNFYISFPFLRPRPMPPTSDLSPRTSVIPPPACYLLLLLPFVLKLDPAPHPAHAAPDRLSLIACTSRVPVKGPAVPGPRPCQPARKEPCRHRMKGGGAGTPDFAAFHHYPLQLGDAKVRKGVRLRSGCVTGAGGEASKARNAEVCLRAGWGLRRPASLTLR